MDKFFISAGCAIVGLVLGGALATIYHTRIAPVSRRLQNALALAEADAAYFKTETQRAKAELVDLKQRIEARIKATADAAQGKA